MIYPAVVPSPPRTRLRRPPYAWMATFEPFLGLPQTVTAGERTIKPSWLGITVRCVAVAVGHD